MSGDAQSAPAAAAPPEHEARRRAATPPHNVRPWPLPRAHSPRVTAWRQQLAEAAGDRHRLDEAVAAITAQVRAEGTPIIEQETPTGLEGDAAARTGSGSSLVTFVWIGDAPHGVALQLNRMTDVIDLADTRLEALEGSPVHALTLRLPHGWLGSYLFVPLPHPPVVTLHRGIDQRAMAPFAAAAQADPFARELLPNKQLPGRAGQPTSLAAARSTGASRAALWRDARGDDAHIADVPSAVTGASLALSRWSHPAATATSPVVLLMDGEVWREQFPIAGELARRVEAGSCPPVHLLFLDSGGPRQRQLDYAGSAAESAQLLASVRGAAGALAGAGPWIVAGQSLGGLFAAHAALRHPELVAAAIAQSPSFWWPAAPPASPAPGWFDEAAVAGPAGRVLVQAGSYEWGLIERARDAAALLRARDELIGFDEYAGGHDVLVWQALLPDAVERVVADLVMRARETDARVASR